MILAKKGLIPSNVIVLRQSSDETYSRTLLKKDEIFGYNRLILDKRIKHFEQNTPHVISFYQKLYNNVIEIDAKRSKWFIEDRAISEISLNLQAR